MTKKWLRAIGLLSYFLRYFSTLKITFYCPRNIWMHNFKSNLKIKEKAKVPLPTPVPHLVPSLLNSTQVMILVSLYTFSQLCTHTEKYTIWVWVIKPKWYHVLDTWLQLAFTSHNIPGVIMHVEAPHPFLLGHSTSQESHAQHIQSTFRFVWSFLTPNVFVFLYAPTDPQCVSSRKAKKGITWSMDMF